LADTFSFAEAVPNAGIAEKWAFFREIAFRVGHFHQ
jgi:hypothetical protein